MNPYTGTDFFGFLALFFQRLVLLCTGQLEVSALATDEIQIFVLSLISIAAALVGTLLVLKKMTMLANSLSHTILLGIVGAYLLFYFRLHASFVIDYKVLFVAALVTGILTTLCTQFLHRVIKLQEDASIGLVFTSMFALGIVCVTIFTRNAHIGTEVVMGNADALHFNDVKIAGAIALLNAIFVFGFYKEWKLICFDEPLALAMGFKPGLFTYLLMLLVSATAISAFRAVGVLLFLAFLVGLPLSARQLSYKFSTNLILGSFLGIGCSLFAVALSRHLLSVYQLCLSTGGLTVCMIAVTFLGILGYKRCRPHLTFSKIPG